jgi:hypothetical protein
MDQPSYRAFSGAATTPWCADSANRSRKDGEMMSLLASKVAEDPQDISGHEGRGGTASNSAW